MRLDDFGVLNSLPRGCCLRRSTGCHEHSWHVRASQSPQQWRPTWNCVHLAMAPGLNRPDAFHHLWVGMLVLLLREHRHASKPSKSRRWSVGDEWSGQSFFYRIIRVFLLRWPLLHQGMDVAHKCSVTRMASSDVRRPQAVIGSAYSQSLLCGALETNSLAVSISELAPSQIAFMSCIIITIIIIMKICYMHIVNILRLNRRHGMYLNYPKATVKSKF